MARRDTEPRKQRPDGRENLDRNRLENLQGQVVEELGAAYYAPLVVIGDRLGLYEALADAGPLTPAELAQRTDTEEAYVDQWLAAGAAGGFVTYDAKAKRYRLTPEQAAVLADEESPAFAAGGYEAVVGAMPSLDEVEAAFREGHGVGWHEHGAGVFHGTERFFRPVYDDLLVDEWLPALEGVESALQAGARVADVGCGHAASTVIMAGAFPESTFVGYDYHEDSVEVARDRAAEAGVDDRVRFEVATAKEFDGDDVDLVTMFDCYHDMGDPVGVAEHVRETLADDGTWMIVEPFAADRVEDNLTPVGRVFYCASTMVCTPNAVAQGGDPVLGTQAGEARLREVVTSGGFSRFRRAAETPFNLVFEATP